jgi:hypothetical protein
MRVRFVVPLLMVSACDGLAPERLLVVAMDASAYTRGSSSQAAVSFTVYNAGHSPLYFVGCETPISARIQRRSGSTWADYAQRNTVCVANIMPATLVLGPGESYRDTFLWDVPGLFRMRVLYGARSDQLWRSEAGTAPFEVR